MELFLLLLPGLCSVIGKLVRAARRGQRKTRAQPRSVIRAAQNPEPEGRRWGRAPGSTRGKEKSELSQQPGARLMVFVSPLPSRRFHTEAKDELLMCCRCEGLARTRETPFQPNT